MNKHLTHSAPLAVALAAGGLVLAACGGGSSGGSGAKASSGGGAYGTTTTTTTTAVHSGPMGKYLTNASGRSVYVFSADTSAMSTCHGQCAQMWPAVMSGGTQVVFHGHPLYYYVQDTSPGDTAGEGITNFGGTWTLVHPDGSAVMASAPKASAKPSPSGTSKQGWG